MDNTRGQAPQSSSANVPPATPLDSVESSTSSQSQSATEGLQSQRLKVAIPRNAPSRDNLNQSRRVAHACVRCRDLRAKCSGERPSCKRCLESGLLCSYVEGKRERTAQHIRRLEEQIRDYERLLNFLGPKLDGTDAQLIRETIIKYRNDGDLSGDDDRPPIVPLSAVSSVATSQLSSAPLDATDLLGGVDYTEEDFNRDERTKTVGFVGKHSEISWISDLKREVEHMPGPGDFPTDSPETQRRQSAAALSYFLDTDLLPIESIEPLEWPSQVTADNLMQIYFTMVHPSFPIIGEDIFLEQYASFYSNPLVRPGRKWLSILNMIFAIASHYYPHGPEQHSDTTPEDLIYFSRAWRLGMAKSALWEHPDLQQVQIEGLTSFYLLSIGHINRSWRICGMAIHSAVAMGLHLRSVSQRIPPTSKQSRYRVWWALYTLETLICNITGRPFCSSKEFCTTPLPTSLGEDGVSDASFSRISLSSQSGGPNRSMSPATPGTLFSQQPRMVNPDATEYFLYYVEMSRIARNAINEIYAPGEAQRPWQDLEAAIKDLNAEADIWLSKLPDAFRSAITQENRYDKHRLSLLMHFYSTKILICKPCIHHPDRRLDGKFCQATSRICFEAACQLLDLFPPEYDPIWLHQVAPWWAILHYLIQSTAVLLIELAYHAKTQQQSQKAPRDPLQRRAGKAIRWFREMSRHPVLWRVYNVCEELLSQLAPRYDQMSDSPRT